MSERPPPPPEGRVITAALKASGLSAREAAHRADISEGRWRQIASGYQVVSAGVHATVRGPADTWARMARVVDATPEAFEEAGRPDIADAIRRDQALAGADPGDEEIDLDTFVPQTPSEKALMAIYRANERANEQRFEELSAKIDRLTVVPNADVDHESGSGEHGQQRKGA